MDITTLALAKSYTNKIAAGFKSVELDGTNLIFTLLDGSTATVAIPTPSDGVSVTNLSIDEDGSLLCHMSDGTTIDAGYVPAVDPDLSNYYTKDEVNQTVGSLEDLSTEDKSNIVSAINESLSKGIRVLTKTTNLYELEDRYGIYKVSEDVSDFINVRISNPSQGSKSFAAYPGEVFIYAHLRNTSASFVAQFYISQVDLTDLTNNQNNLFIRIHFVPLLSYAIRQYDFPLSSANVIRNYNNLINGLYTYNTLPETSAIPTTNNQMVNKKYVDDSISAAIATALEGDY